jgi:uncharacterized membrane protein (Fun14 family)
MHMQLPMNDNPNPSHTEAVAAIVGHNPPWKAKSVWIAAVMVIIGGFLWVKDAARKSESSVTGTTAGGMSLADTGTGSIQPPPAGSEPTSPATFRFGVSYLGGFFLGWSLRRFIKWTLLLGGAVILVIGLGRKLGWFDLDWASIEGQVRSSLTWLQGEAGAAKQFLTGYLPSAGAAAIGIFLGFRRK